MRQIALIIILFIAFVTRFWQLGNVPFGITNDEASYIYSAYTAWKTAGHDLNGNFLPLSINVVSDLSPAPVYLASPFVGILGVSAFSGRLPFALLGLLTVLLSYLIARKLFSEPIALLSALVFSVSPWHLLVSRAAYDGVVALFFLLLTLYILLVTIEKGNINWALIPFTFAFYSYHGTKIVAILLPVIVIVLFSKEFMKRKKEVVLFASGILLLIFSFFIVTKFEGVSRQSVLFWNDPTTIKQISDEVNFQREKSTAPFFVRQIFHNKPILYTQLFIDSYTKAFSPEILFTHGDIFYLNSYGVFFKGSLYILELPLLLLGLFYMIKKSEKRVLYLILSLLIIAPIPSAVAAGQSYIIRSITMLPFLMIIVGCGLYFIYSKLIVFDKRILLIGISSLVLLYGFFVSEFLYQYYFQFNLYGQEQWFGSSRKVSQYIAQKKTVAKKIYVVNREKAFILQYAINNSVEPQAILHVWKNPTGSIDNVYFSSNCIFDRKNPMSLLQKDEVLIAPNDCYTDNKYATTVVDPIERQRIVWKIYEKK